MVQDEDVLSWCQRRSATTTWSSDERGRHVVRLQVLSGSAGNRVVVVAGSVESTATDVLTRAVWEVIAAEEAESRRSTMRIA